MANIKRANASGITKPGTAISDVPDAPTIGTATGGNAAATVTYTAAATGGTATTFTATSSPGSLTGTGASPITISGLTNGTSYTFTVTASNSTGTSPASSASNSVTPVSLGDMDPIAMVEVGSGGAVNVEITSIPATYTHLQIRGIARSSANSTGGMSLYMQFNSDTGANYSRHYLGTYQGQDAAVWAGGAANESFIIPFLMPTNLLGASIFTAGVIDILDYANTNKYKTTRSLGGYDMNGATSGYNYLNLNSGSWRNTAAITSIKLYGASQEFMQYSQFALYGIKDA